jgi:hypothetical protein
MRSLIRPFVLGLSLVLVASTSAGAADFCVQTTGGDDFTLVAKDFTLPRKGRCKVWTGILTGFPSLYTASTGTACTESDGSHLNLTVHSGYAGFGIVAITHILQLPFPTLTGGAGRELLNTGLAVSFVDITDASRIDCVPSVVPIAPFP